MGRVIRESGRSEQENAADSDQDISSLQERLLITCPTAGRITDISELDS
jgi:hypothetical protein